MTLNLGPDRRVAVERAQSQANQTGKPHWMWLYRDDYFLRADKPADMPVLAGVVFEQVDPSAAAAAPPKELSDFTEPQIQVYMQQMGHAVSGFLPGGAAPEGRAFFSLLIFDTPNLVHYVTNAARSGVIRSLRTLADRLENETEQNAEDPLGLDAG